MKNCNLKRLATALLLVAIGSLGAWSQLFYKVEGKGLSKPSYLFGTHHFTTSALADSLGVLDALDKVSGLVSEVDMTDINMLQLAMHIQKYIQAPPDSTLSVAIGDAETYGLLNEKLCEKTGYTMCLQMFENLRPIAVVLLSSQADMSDLFPDFQLTEQVDRILQVKAKERGLSIIGLETIDEQAELLYCGQSIAEQVKSMISFLTEPQDIRGQILKLNQYYFAGDLDGMLQLSLEQAQTEADRDYQDRLLKKRNQAWMQVLPGLIQSEPRLVIVGAMHLAGPDGLVEQLRKLGYSVKAVKTKPRK